MTNKLNKHSKKGLMSNISAVLCVLGLGALGFATSAYSADVAVDALPTNGQVVAGDATIHTAGTAAAPVMNINQTSQRAIVNWDKFDVGTNSTVNFNQPNAQASTLNRISGNNPSQIMGKINAPGEVILMNQQGVYFTRDSKLDVGSVVATSHNISNDDYMAGKATYDRNGATGKVINEGTINTGLGGYVALLAPEVRNSGVIVAKMGTVVLAAGERITLNFDPSRHLASITATPSAIDALIENRNAVKAPGGLIILSAKAVNTLTAGVIKNSGTLSASTDSTVAIRQGGRILLTANHVKLEAGSQTVARGQDAGGKVEIAAAQTATVEATAKVSVSATETGNAGTIAIHADEKTTINGTLLAQGGKVSGNGGVINTTSNGQVEIGSTAEVKAGVRGSSGNVGTWNVTAAAMKVNTTNAPVISQSLNTNNVKIKVSTAGCAQAGNCNVVANAVSNAGLNLAQLEITQNAVIQKTSPVLTNLTMEASGAAAYNAQASGSLQVQNRILIDGKIISAELSPLTLQILSDNLVEIRQNADLQAAKIEVISENGLYNGSLLSYFAGGNGSPLPAISLFARTLAIAGSLKSGAQNRAGSIKINGQDSVSIQNSSIIANGSDGGSVEIVSMNGTVSLVNSVVQTNGGEGRGGAISVAGLHDVAISGATLEATGTTQGGQVSLTSYTGDINFANAIVQTNGGSGLGGTIRVDAFNTLNLNGQLLANSQSAKAGQITLEAKDILLDTQANLQATGATGGGNILVGGDWQGSGNLRQAISVTMNQGAVIDASATQNGNGGKVVIWSNVKNSSATTEVHGSIFAKGGMNGGLGGRVETSGGNLNINGIQVNTLASDGSGGIWLLDPYNFFLDSGELSTIASNLNNNGNIEISTANTSNQGASNDSYGFGHIVFMADFTYSGSNSRTLTLTADGDIYIQGNITASGSGALGVTFNASGDQVYLDGNITTNGGAVSFNASEVYFQKTSGTQSITTNGGNLSFNSTNIYLLKLPGNDTVSFSTAGGALNLGSGSIDLTTTRTSISAPSLLWNGWGGVSTSGYYQTRSYVNITAGNEYTVRLYYWDSWDGEYGQLVVDVGGSWYYYFSASAASGSLSNLQANYSTSYTQSGYAALGRSGWNDFYVDLTFKAQHTGTLKTWTSLDQGYDDEAFELYNVYQTPISTSSYTSGARTLSLSSTTGQISGSKNISNMAGLTVNTNNTSSSLSGVISGGGSLTKSGTGTLTLSNSSTYSGATTVDAGTLSFNSTGKIYYSAAGNYNTTVTVNSGAVLDLYSWDWTGSLSTLLYEPGNLVINGGTVRSSGPSNAAAGTNMSSRSFTIGAGGATFDSANSAATWIIDRDTRAGTYQTNIAGNVTFTGAGNIVFNQYLTGAYTVTKNGAGTTTLGGSNTYTGTTTISAGTLQIGRGSTAGTLGTGSITNNASLVINRSDFYLLNNTISGSGSLTKQASGQLALTAANTYSGGTTVSAGSIGAYTNTALGSGALSLAANTTLYIGRAVTEIANNISLAGAATIAFDTNVDYLIVAGGGGGAGGIGSGGGAGEFINSSTSLAGTTYAVTVGAGGAGGAGDSAGSTGGVSSLIGSGTSISAAGGGGGGAWGASGLSGGSGGGGGAGAVTVGGSSVKTGGGLGNAGGAGVSGSGATAVAAGGGGAGGPGSSGNTGTQSGGNGGAGAASSITGSSVMYAGGGGGGLNGVPGWSSGSPGQGDAGGGNGGAKGTSRDGFSATANSGSGGGGASNGSLGGAGGSGIVIVRYLGSDASTGGTDVPGTGSAAGYTVVSFTSTGSNTLTFNALSTKLSGVISNSGNLTLNAAGGTFTLTGTNTYSGNTSISAGTVVVGITGSLGSGNYTGTISNSGTFKYSSSTNQTLGGVMSGTGALIKDTSSSSVLTLSAANTYTGGTTISAGTVTLGNAAGLGGSAGVVSVAGGAVLDLNGQTVTNTNALTLNGTGISSGGALVNSSATAASYAGSVSLATDSSISTTAGNITLGGVVGGSGALTKISSNTLTLSNASNSYTGNTTISGGILSISADGNLGAVPTNTTANSITLSGGALQATGTMTLNAKRGITMTIASGLAATSGNTLTVNGVVMGAFGLTINGANQTGTVILAGTNTYTGSTTISAGTLQIGNGGTTGSFGSGDVLNNAALKIDLAADTTIANNISGTGSIEVVGRYYRFFDSGSASSLSNSTYQQVATNMTVAELLNRLAGGLMQGTAVVGGTTGVESGVNNKTYDAATNTASFYILFQDTQYTKRVKVDLRQSGANVEAKVDSSALEFVTNITAALLNLSDTTAFTGDMVYATSYSADGYGLRGLDSTAKITFTGNLTHTGATTLSGGTYTVTGGSCGTGFACNYVKYAKPTVAVAGSLSASAITNNGVLIFANTAAQELSGVMSGSGVVINNAAGNVTLSAANTFSGNIYLQAGKIIAANNAAFGTAPVYQVKGLASTIDVNGKTLTNNFYLYGSGPSSAGAITNGSSTAATISGAVGLMADSAVNTDNQITISGIVSGAYNLTKSGSGTLTLSNANNTYSGGTTISGGILSIGTDRNLGAVPASITASSITLSGGALQATGAATLDAKRGITMTADSGLAATSTNTLTVNGIVTGNFGLTINGASQAGTVVLAGTNTYTGITTISAGTLSVSADANLGTGNISLGGTLAITGSTAFSSSKTITLTAASTISNSNTGGATFSGNISNGANLLTIDNSQAMTLSGLIGNGGGGLTKSGAGTLTLSGTNSYTGNTTISAGTLSVSADANLGTGNISLGGTLAITGSTAFSSSKTITLTAASTISNSNTGGATFSGNISNGAYLLTISNTQATTLSGVIGNGAGGLSKSGAGTLTLSGTNSYTGNTTVSGGILSISADGNLGAVPTSTTANSIALSGGVLQATGAVTLDAKRGITMTVNSGLAATSTNTLTVNGVVTGAFGLTINGVSQTGTVTLAGINTYTGTTSVSAGTLAITNAAGLGTTSGGTTVANGATLDLQNVVVGNEAITLNGGTLSTSTGTSSLSGGITLGANSTVSVAGTQLTLSGIISGSTFGITKSGIGTLILSNANTYTGNTNINAGTLKLTGGLSSSTNVVMTGTAIWDLQVAETIASLTMAAGNKITNNAGSSSLTVSGISTLANSITTSGAQTYTGAVTLAADTAITASDLTFSATVNSNATTAQSLIITNSGTATFNGIVGGTYALSSLSVSGAANLYGNVNTTGAQTYSGNVSVGGDISLNSTSGGVTLGGTITGVLITGTLLYETTTPLRSGNNVVYSQDNSASFNDPITRITYRMEVTVGGTPYYAEVSFDAWSGVTESGLKFPDLTNKLVVQQIVYNMIVRSNATSGAMNSTMSSKSKGVITGSGFTGYLELWPWDYGTATDTILGSTVGSGSIYDYNDNPTGASSYGSFQVHNITSGSTQTVIAWNHPFADAYASSADIGLGDSTSSNTDWTFTSKSTATLGTTDWKLQVLVNERNPTLTINAGTGEVNVTGATSGLKALTVNTNASTASTIIGAISNSASDATTLTKQGTGTLVLKGANTYTGATTISAGDLIVRNNAPSTSSAFNGPGTLTLEPSSTSFTSAINTSSWTFNSNLGGLTIGKDGNTQNITVNSATSIAGPISIYGGAITINSGLTATGTNTITLKGTGNVTDGTSGYVSASNLLLLGGNVTLDSTSNAIGRLAASGVSGLTYVDTNALTIGTVGSTNGVSATGVVSIGTNSGDLTISQNVATTNTTSSALVLNAGISTAAGTSTGGNIIISGSPTISVGSGGTAKLYTGAVAGSTGLAALISAGNFRYNSDEATTNYTTTLATGLNAIYRERPTISAIAVDNKSITYGDSLPAWTYTMTGAQNGETLAQAFSGITMTVGGSKSTSNNYIAGDHTLTASGTPTSLLGYAFSGTYTTGTLSVAQKSLTVTYTGVNKAYDGGLTAAVTTGDNRVTNDVLTIARSAAFTDKNVANSIAVNVTGASISGTDAANYSLASATGSTTANITAKTVALSATKEYDGNANLSTVIIATGVGSETLTYSGATANSPNVATASKYINAITLADATDSSGGLASNYQLPSLTAASANNAVTITAKALTVTANNDSKTYGATKTYGAGSTAFIASGLVGVQTIGSVTITDTNNGGVATANAGGTYALTPSAATGGSFTASNYNITYTAGVLSVGKATLTVTADAKSMTYGDNSLPNLTATISGFVNSQNLGTSGVTGSASLSTTATAYDGSTAGSASVAGSYTITPTVGTLAASNYAFSYATGTLTVGKANLTITAANDSKIYGATTTAANIAYSSGVAAGVSTGYSVSGLVNGDTISSVTLTSTGANATATVAGGPYTITPSALSGSTRTTTANYNITYTNASTGLTVNKATLTVTAVDKTRVYGDANPSFTYAITGYVNAENATSANVTGAPSLSTTATQGSNVGTYTITAAANNLAAANYQFSYVNGTLTVNRRPVTVTGDNKSKTYGDANPSLTYTVAADGSGTSRGLYSTNTLSGAVTTVATTTTGVGGVAITQGTLTNANNANYDITYNDGTLTINKATLTVTANNQTRVYGDANPALTYVITGYKNSEDATLAGLTGTPTISTAATQGSNVNTYTITSAANNLAAANYQFSYVNGTLTVNRRPVTVTADNQTRIYGAVNPTLTYTVAADGTGTSRGLYSTDTLTGAVATAATATTNVGTVSITQGTLSNTNNANYDITYNAGTLTINQKALTITANNDSKIYGSVKTYGSGSTAFTSSGLTNSETIGSVTLTDTNSGGVATANAGGTYALTPSAATGGTFNIANYSVTYVAGALTVNKATLTVTANNQTRVYGDANPALTYTITGYQNSENATSAGLTGTPTISTAATQGSNVNTYTITSAANNLAAANYQFSYVNGTLTVNRRPVTVTADNQTRIYGAANPTLTYTVAADGTGTSRGLYSTDTLTGALATTATTSTGVGTPSITQGTVTNANNANYDITYNNGTLTINKATLTYNATAASSTYGSTPSVNAGNVTGFVNGESASNLTGTLLFSTTATSTSNVGSYAITGSGYSSSNYQFVQAAGNSTALTIGQKALTVTASSQSTTYGTALTLGTSAFSTTGLVNSDTVTAVTLLQGGNSTVPATQGAGTYTGSSNGIIASGATGTGLSNYSITYTAGALTINKATLIVTADNQTRVYGDANPTLTYTITGYKNAEDATSAGLTGAAAMSTTATAASNVNTYTITSAANNLAAANYQFSYANGTLTVNRRPVTVTADNKTRIYGAANPSLTYTVAADGTGTSRGLYSTDTLTGAVTTAATATTNVGTVAITQNTLINANNGNYDITFNNGTLTINKATLTVTADAKSMTYGDSSLPNLTATISGFVNSQNLGTSGVTGSASLSTTATAYDGSTAGSASVAGSYTITPTVGTLAASNYAFSYATGTLTVGKANLTITAANDSKIYGATTTAANIAYSSGVAAGVSTGYSVSGLVNGDTISSVTLTSTGANATATVAGGPYTITPSALSGSTRTTTANYNITYTNASTGLSVNQKALTITADARSTTYGTALVLGTTGYTQVGLVNSDAITGVTLKHGTNTTVPVTQAAGTYTNEIIASAAQGSGLANYSITYVPNTLTVNQKALTITANNDSKIYGSVKTYGSGSTAFTSSGLTNSETIGSVTVTDTNSGGVATANAGGTYALTPSAATGGTFNIANYSVTYVAGALTVNQKALTITANAQNTTYGTALALGTTAYTSSGLSNGDSISGVTLTQGGNTTVPATQAAGIYSTTSGIVPSAAQGSGLTNYNITYANGALTINKATLTYVATAATSIYGSTPSVNAGTVTGYVNGESASDLTGTLLFSTTATSSSNVGSYAVTGSGYSSSNYNFVQAAANNTALTINQKALTITADARSTTYGTALVLGTTGYTQVGLVNSDAITGVTLKHGTNTTVPVTQAAGTYTNEIIASAAQGSGLANYSITYVPNTLTVNQKALTITADARSTTYGTALVLGTTGYTQVGLVNSDAITGVTLKHGTNTTVPVTQAAGTYSNEIVASAAQGSGLANYSITYVPNTLTVNQKALTVTANAQSTTYGTALVLGTSAYTTSGLVNGDTVSAVTLLQGSNATVPATQNAGTYSGSTNGIIASAAQGSGLANYSITYVANTLTVNQKALTITADARSTTYGTALVLGTTGYTQVGLVNSDAITGVTLKHGTNTTVPVTQAAGTYSNEIVASAAQGSGLANYSITYVPNTLTVNQKALTVTANAQSTTYGTALVLGTTAYTSSGLTNGDSISGVTLTQGGNTTVPATQAAGTYSGSTNGIIASAAQGSGLANYSITYVANTLTVNQKALTITADARSTTYGTALVLGTTGYTQVGLVNSDAITGVTLKHGTNTTVPVTQAAGTYSNEIIASAAQGSGLANYSITYVPNTLTVNKYAVSITAPTVTKEYDGNTTYAASSQDLNNLSSYLLNGDTVTATTMTYANKNVSANNKSISLDAITIANGQASNYIITLLGNSSSSVTRLASATWIGGATGDWFNPANWAKTSNLAQTGAVPDLANVAAVVIPSSARVTFDNTALSGLAEAATVNVNSVTGGGLNITHGQLIVANNASLTGLDSSAGTTLTVGGALNLNMANDGLVSGVVAGAASLTKSGSGALTLAGDNTYTGGTTVNAGTLFGGAGSLTNAVFGTGTVTVNSGATLWLDRATLANNLVLNNAVLQSTNGFGEVFNGNIALTGSNEIRSYSYTTINGVVSGTGSINKTQSGVLTLTANNTYTGASHINAGAVNVTGALSDSAVVTVANGAIYQVAANDTIASLVGTGGVVLNGVLTLGDSSNSTFAGVMSGTGSLVKQGAGTFTLAGVNTYTGTTTISAGTLALNGNGSISSSSRLEANGVFDISGATGGMASVVGLSGIGSILQGNSSLNITAANGDNFSGVISGTGDLTLVSGTQTLSGNNTYTGTTYVMAGGRLIAANSNALGSTAAATVVAQNAVLELNAAVGNETINLNRGTLKGNGSLSGNVLLGGNSIVSADTGNTFTLSGVVSGGYGITKTGAGTVVLTGNNTYSGGTTVNAGMLRVTSNLGSTNAGLLLANSGQLDLQTGLTVGTLTMQNSASIISTGGASSLTVAGVSNLMNGVATNGAQTYQSAVHLNATTSLNSNGGNILFNGVLDAPSNTKVAQVNLNVDAGAGSVTFNQVVGDLGSSNNNYRSITANSNLYELNVTARKIYINADINTMQHQIYNGAVVIGGNDRTRTLLSLDPMIQFNGTVDDSVANTHTLVARAVAVKLSDGSLMTENPKVIFEQAVGASVPLYSLEAVAGWQSTASASKAGEVDPVTPANRYFMVGDVTIKGSVSTMHDQTYVANAVGLGGTDPTLTLTTKTGKVNILIGKNFSSGQAGGVRGATGTKFMLKYGSSGTPNADTLAALKDAGLNVSRPVMGGFADAAQSQREVKAIDKLVVGNNPVVKVGEARVANYAAECSDSDQESGKCSVK